MSWVVAVAYVIGLGVGYAASANAAFARVWPAIVRTQMAIAPLLLTISAVWRIESFAEVAWASIMSIGFLVLWGVAYLTQRGPRRLGHAALQTMAVSPNTGFFLLPVAAAFGGSAALAPAVLADRVTIPIWSAFIGMLRRDAPIRQSRRTGFVDQASLIALAVGLLLRATVPAPAWTEPAALWMTPIIALTGAATFMGSVLHPTQRIDYRPGVRRWLTLVGLRLALYAAIFAVVPTDGLRVVALLCALSIPTFAPPQWATLYGYSDPVLATSNRFGWFLGAAGVLTLVWWSAF